MANFVQKWKAERRIPHVIRGIVDSINKTYSELNLDDGDFNGLSEKEKTSKLIEVINSDPEIFRLNSLARIGSIKIIRQVRGRKTDYGMFIPSQGNGINLCMGDDGLYIYDWDDGREEYSHEISPNPDSLGVYGIDAEGLKEAVMDYTNRGTYIERVADFRMFRS